MENMEITRRNSLKLFLGGAGASLIASRLPTQAATDPLSGSSLFEYVKTYDRLGEHRTATPADNATSHWLVEELQRAGLTAELQSVPANLFVPDTCSVRLSGQTIRAFPAWPPCVTDGAEGVLVAADAADVSGRIAFVDMPAHRGASWKLPGATEAVQRPIVAGALAVIVCTDGPTGEMIAQNAEPASLRWKVPVVLVGGKFAVQFKAAIAAKARVRVVSTGVTTPTAQASNVVASRPGKGKTVVVSTPKSGWFHCAGERGTGLAIFLGLAHRLAHETVAPLVFVATTGHEVAETGASLFLKLRAPAPAATRMWLHIGANIAMRKIAFDGLSPRGLDEPSDTVRIATNPGLLSAARDAFANQPGYQHVIPLDPAKAPGELAAFLDAGYERLAGMVGSSPVFHTMLDRTELATTPQCLEAVAHATHDFLRASL